MKLRASPLLIALVVAVAGPARAQDAPTPRWRHQAADVPASPRIHFSTLPNGLRVAWVHNGEPKKRSYLRLHVDVGSLAEEDDERGLAHFLEHMAFNGTKNHPADSLVEWFQRHGMSFGADTNASTGFSQTAYQIDLPESDRKSLAEGLAVLRDFADGMLLEQKEIDKEKGVIDAEERERDSPQYRTLEKTLRVQFSGTRVPERLPIGRKEVRDAFTSESVRRFYSKWYRPENMTLVLAGDLADEDPDALVATAFGDMARPATPSAGEPAAGTPDMAHRFYTVAEKEIPYVQIGVQLARPWAERPDSRAQWRADLPVAFARSMLNLRFAELSKRKDAPFLGAGSGDVHDSMSGLGVRVQEGQLLAVACRIDRWQAALAAAEQELRRTIEFGFEQKELDRVRADVLRSLDESVEREQTKSSAAWVDALLAAAENGTVPCDAATRRDIVKPWITALDVDACKQAWAKAWSEGTLVIGTAGTLDLDAEAAKVLQETYEASRATKIEAKKSVELAPFAYASVASESGQVESRSHDAEFDLHQITFANGVRAWIKKTDFKEKQILVSVAFAEGRLDAAPEPVVWVAERTFDGCGLEAHSTDDLRKLFAGKEVSSRLAVEEDQFEWYGSTTREDLVSECELLRAGLEHPGWREEGLTQLQKQVPILYESMLHTHGGPVDLQFLPELYANCGRHSTPRREAVEAVGLADVRGWLEPHLATGPIDIIMVGDLDVDAAERAIAQTFGVLPQRRARDARADERKPLEMLTGLRRHYEIDTKDDKALALLVFPATDGRDPAVRRGLALLADVLTDRLRVEVREKLGASYSPMAGAQTSEVFPGDGSLVVQSMTDPLQADAVVATCLAVADKIAKDGITDEELDRLRAPALAALRDARRTNAHWRNALARLHARADALEDLRTEAAWLEGVRAAELNALAARFLLRDKASVAIVTPTSGEARKR